MAFEQFENQVAASFEGAECRRTSGGYKFVAGRHNSHHGTYEQGGWFVEAFGVHARGETLPEALENLETESLASYEAFRANQYA